MSKKAVTCFRIREPGHACPGVFLSIRLSDNRVRAGRSVKAKLVYHNTNDFPVIVDGGQPEIATFIDPDTGREVGGFQGAIAGTGVWSELAPGKTASIPLIVAASATSGLKKAMRGDQGPLPEGSYRLRATTTSCDPNEGGSCREWPPAFGQIEVVSGDRE